MSLSNMNTVAMTAVAMTAADADIDLADMPGITDSPAGLEGFNADLTDIGMSVRCVLFVIFRFFFRVSVWLCTSANSYPTCLLSCVT